MTPPAINQTMTPREWSMLVLLSVVWGAAFLFNGIAIKELPPLTIVLARVGSAALILYLVVKAMRLAMPTDLRTWRALFVMGALQNVLPFSLIVWGQTHIPSGLASILNATTPLWTVLVAHLMTVDEKMTPARVVGVMVGLAGVVVMIGPAAFEGFDIHFFAQFAGLAASLSYAFSAVFGRRFAKMGLPPLLAATGQVMAATIILLPAVLLIDQPWTFPGLPSGRVLVVLFGIGSLSTALAFFLYFRLLASAGATNTALVTLLVPVSAILLGALVLGERLDPRHFAGMGLIAAGFAAIDGRMFRWIAARRTA